MRVAWAWRLHKTYKTYKTYKMMIGAPLYTPWVCGAAVWNGSGVDVPLVYARQLDGNGGVRNCGGVALA